MSLKINALGNVKKYNGAYFRKRRLFSSRADKAALNIFYFL